MIGYVILIVITISLSTGVFIYLKLYLPDDKPECSQDIDLSVDDLTCSRSGIGTNYIVGVNFTNRGLFSVDSVFIKIGDADRILKTTLNKVDEDRMKSICNNNNLELSLKPGAEFCKTYTYSANPVTLQELTIEPLVWIENQPILCPESIVTKLISCQ